MNKNKPPLGVPPEYVHIHNSNMERVEQILDAIKRYAEGGHEVPLEWIAELTRRVKIKN